MPRVRRQSRMYGRSLVLGAAATLTLAGLACSGHEAHAPAPHAAAPSPATPAQFRPEVLPLPADPADYEPLATYAAMEIPADNPLTAEKAALGRQLYFDKRLSGDLARSCYSCHVCEKGLTDGRALALGAFDKPLTRSAPTMWNVGFHHDWYWDGRAKTLEAQALAAWKGANMGANPEAVAATLDAIPGYAAQFRAVFGGPATPDAVSKALAAYMRTIVGGRTAWDRWQAGDAAALSDAAKRGWDVFQQAGCNGCHAGALLTDLQYHNVGVGMGAAEPDVGRFKVTNVEQNRGAFKTPTLRDIAQSAPYFHDGSVATLEDAVTLMLAGGLPNQWKNTDKLKPVQLTGSQFSDLIAFLKSLDEPCDMPAPPLPPDA
jgi:cytochrome c peroxidase